jgi:hypothetical protein
LRRWCVGGQHIWAVNERCEGTETEVLVILLSLKGNDNAKIIVPEMAILNIFPPHPRTLPFLLHGDIVIGDIERIILILDNSGCIFFVWT